MKTSVEIVAKLEALFTALIEIEAQLEELEEQITRGGSDGEQLHLEQKKDQQEAVLVQIRILNKEYWDNWEI